MVNNNSLPRGPISRIIRFISTDYVTRITMYRIADFQRCGVFSLFLKIEGCGFRQDTWYQQTFHSSFGFKIQCGIEKYHFRDTLEYQLYLKRVLIEFFSSNSYEAII